GVWDSVWVTTTMTSTSKSFPGWASRLASVARGSSRSPHACRSSPTAMARSSELGSRQATASSGDEMSDDPGEQFVSTGDLPRSEQVEALVLEAHARFEANTEGDPSKVYPILAR